MGSALSYYSASQAKIYFNGIFIDECYDLQYAYREAKEPVYGYLSQHYSDIVKGTVIVHGAFTINYKHDQYLTKVLQKAALPFGPGGQNQDSTNSIVGSNKSSYVKQGLKKWNSDYKAVLLETSNKSIELRKVANETPTQAEVDELKAPWEAEKKNAKEDWNVKLAAKNVSQTDLNLMYDTTPSLMGKVSSYYSFIDRDGYNFNKELYDRLGLASWVNANPTLDGGELISIARDTPLTGISLTPGDGNCVAIQQNRGELSRVTGEITLKQNLILNLESSINEDTKKINDLINISGNETEVKKLQDKIQSNSLSLKNYQKSLTDSQKEMSDIIESEDSIRASVNSQAEDIWAADPALKDAIMKEQEYEVLYNANKEAETLYTNSQQYKTVVGKAYGEISTKRDNGLAKQKSLQGDIDNGITQANTLKNQRQYLANNLEVNNKDFNTSGEKWERAEDKFRDGGFNIQIYYNDTLHKIIEGCELMGHSHGISMSGQVIKEGYTFIGKKLTEIK